MHAIRFHNLGEPDVLKLETLDQPTPRVGELLIKMEAAGLNFSDILVRRGMYPEPAVLPHTPGSEVAGEVVGVGAGVEAFAVGDRVAGVSPWRSGGYAEYAILPADVAASIPSGVTAAQAIAASNQGATAYHLLTTMAALAPGKSVLVSAAGGGVGGLIIQLAKRLGAGTVIGLASTGAKRAAALASGADFAIDPHASGWADEVRAQLPHGVDIFLDSVGGEVFETAVGLLGPFGRAVAYGLASGQQVPVMPMALLQHCHGVAGFHLDAVMAREGVMAETLGRLYAMVASGELTPRIAKSFTLAEAAAAHAFMESRQADGKIVLVP